MIFACGLSNYSVGFFHLTNHAFLCAVLVRILFHITSIVVVKRPAYVVINYLFKLIVEINWTVKVKIINLIWVWLVKNGNIIVIKVENLYNVMKLYLKLIESLRLTTQESIWIKHCDIRRRWPYIRYDYNFFFCIKKILNIFDFVMRKRYYNQSISYGIRCDNLNNKQIKFSISRYFCMDLGTLQSEIRVLTKNLYPKLLKNLNVNKNPVRNNSESFQKLVNLQQKLLSLSSVIYGVYDIKTGRVFVLVNYVTLFTCVRPIWLFRVYFRFLYLIA